MSTGSKDGAFRGDAKLAAGVDVNLNQHVLNCDTTGTLLVDISGGFPGSLTVLQGTTPWVVSGTVNLANEPTIDIGIVDQGIPNTLANGWPVEITDGTNILGTVAHPLNVTGTASSPNVNVHDGSGNTIASTGTSLNVDVTNTVPVTGTFFQATQPISGSITVLNASIPVTQSGAWTVGVNNFPATQPISGSVSVLNFPASQVVTLASTTITGSVAVTGTFFQATQPVSGTVAVSNFPATVAVTQSTSPWVVNGTSTVSGTITANQGTANTTANAWPIEVTGGSGGVGGTNILRVDSGGNTVTKIVDAGGTNFATVTSSNALKVDLSATASNAIPVNVAGTITTTPPANASTNLTQVGGAAISEGQKLMAASVPVVIASDQSAIPVTGTITTSPNVNVHDSSGNAIGSTGTSLNVNTTGTVTTQAGSVTSITGTVGVTQSTSPWVVSGTVTTTPPANASTNITQVGGAALAEGQTTMANSVPVVIASNQSAIPISGTVTITPSGTQNENLIQVAGVTLGSTAVTNYGTTPAATAVPGVNAFITNTPAVTLASTTITGNVTVVQPTGTNLHVVNDASSAVIGHVITDTGSTTAVTGTVAVTQSTSPWVVSGTVTTTPPANASTNIVQVAGVTLGATAVTNYGTAPAAAAVPGVNAFITNTPAVTLTSTTLTGTSTVAGNKTNNNAAPGATNVGALVALANAAAPTNTEGDLVLLSVDLAGNQRTNIVQVANTNAVTSIAGAFGVGGDTANAAADAGNPVKIGGVARLTLPTAVTDGQRVNGMYDKFGRKCVVLGSVRDLRGSQTTTISASTAETTIVTAGAASVFNDMVMVVVANTSAATNTRIDFRDATAGSVIFSLQCPANQTVGWTCQGRALSQTTAANNWTAQCGTSTTDVRIFVQYDKNK